MKNYDLPFDEQLLFTMVDNSWDKALQERFVENKVWDIFKLDVSVTARFKNLTKNMSKDFSKEFYVTIELRKNVVVKKEFKEVRSKFISEKYDDKFFVRSCFAKLIDSTPVFNSEMQGLIKKTKEQYFDTGVIMKYIADSILDGINSKIISTSKRMSAVDCFAQGNPSPMCDEEFTSRIICRGILNKEDSGLTYNEIVLKDALCQDRMDDIVDDGWGDEE